MIDTKALRQKILDMAIKGKLVPQDPNDEPASVLLERIRAEKQQLIKEGKIKKDKNDSVIFKGDDNRYYEKIGSEVKDITDEVPFEIPDSWAWVKLPQIAQIELGKTLNKNTDEGEDVQYLCSINVQWEGIKLDFVKRAKFTTNEQEKYRLRKNDLLICEGGEAGRSSVWNHNDIMYYQNALHRVRFIKGINAYFFKAVFDRYSTMGLISKYCVGVTIKHLTSSALNAIFFPMPPLFEQQRIMSRVEELFDQIAAIEQNQSNIDTLYEEFKKRTLTLAIQGKLVPQDPNDEPASVLLERVRAEKKAKLGKKYVDSYIYKGDDNCYYEKVGRNEPVRLEDLPFEIPDSWCWARLKDVTFNHGQKIPNIAFSYIDIGSIDNVNQKLSAKENIVEPEKAPSRARKIVERGDVLYATVRPYLHNMCVVEKDFSLEPIASTGFAVLAVERGIKNTFLFYYMLSPVFDQYANSSENSKGVAYPAINDEKLYKAPIPIPPQKEQQNICKLINNCFSVLILKDEG